MKVGLVVAVLAAGGAIALLAGNAARPAPAAPGAQTAVVEPTSSAPSSGQAPTSSTASTAADDDGDVLSRATFSEEADSEALSAATTFWRAFTDRAPTHEAWVAELVPLVTADFCHTFGQCDQSSSSRTGEHFDVNGIVEDVRVERTASPEVTRVYFRTDQATFYLELVRADDSSPWIVARWF